MCLFIPQHTWIFPPSTYCQVCAGGRVGPLRDRGVVERRGKEVSQPRVYDGVGICQVGDLLQEGRLRQDVSLVGNFGCQNVGDGLAWDYL